MASGAWEWGGSNSWSAGRLEFYSTSNGSAANTSTVTLYLYARRVDGGTSWNDSSGNNFYVTIDGTTYGNSGGCRVSGTGWTLVKSASKTVSHNSDGSKSITISAGGNIGGTTFNINSYSVNVTLDKIPRYTSISSFALSSTTQTTALFTWKTADNVSKVEAILNDSSTITVASGISSTSGTFTLTGLNPGITYNVKLRVTREDSGLTTTGSNVPISTVPIATISNSNINFNIGSNLTLTFKDYSNNQSYLALDVQLEDSTWEIGVIKTEENIQVESYTWDLSTYSSILYSKLANNNTTHIRIRCGTTIDGVTYENSVSGSMNIVNSNPSFSTYSYGNSDFATNNILANTSYLIQGYGNMQAQISVANKATAKNGASMVKYVGYVLNSSDAVEKYYEIAWSESSEIIFNFGNFSEAGTYTIYIHAIDSRGNVSPEISTNFYVLPYHLPKTRIEIDRYNSYEKEIILSFRSYYSKVLLNNTQKNNSFTAKYRIKEVTSSEWDNYTSLSGFSSSTSTTDSNDMLVVLNKTVESPLEILDETKSYNIEFTISDRVNSVTEEYLISAGIPIMLESETGQVSVNMIPNWDSDAKFQVGTDILATDVDGTQKLLLEEINKINNNLLNKVYPVGSIYMSVNYVSPESFIGGTWVDWGSGRVPVGVSADDNEFNTIEKTGGEKTHVLSLEEMPMHQHYLGGHTFSWGNVSGMNVGVPNAIAVAQTSANNNYLVTKQNSWNYSNFMGSGYAHNNLQPYITCYMWKRVA